MRGDYNNNKKSSLCSPPVIMGHIHDPTWKDEHRTSAHHS